MIDFHTHFLPNIDDGAKDVETSLEMLRCAKSDGINTVVSTSHIYITDQSSIDEFLLRRQASFSLISDEVLNNSSIYPEIELGAEVHIRGGIGDYERISDLKIGNTNYILLEMPYSEWNESHFETVYDITSKGLVPVMAHIERFYNYRDLFDNLKSLGVKFQVNADSFLEKQGRRELLELFQNGYVHLLGSDTHNLRSRPNNLKKAYEIIREKYGIEYENNLIENANKFFDGEKIIDKDLPNLGFMKKMKL